MNRCTRNQLLVATIIFLDCICEPIREQVKAFKFSAGNCGSEVQLEKDRTLVDRFMAHITK